MSKPSKLDDDSIDRHTALLELGAPNRAGGRKGLVYESTAMKLLDISRELLRELCEPVEEVVNPHYRSGPPSRLYDPRDLVIAKEDPAILISKIPFKPPRKKVDYPAKFAVRYPSKEAAIPDAAEALWNLNRYARHAACKRSNQEEIYDLKSKFLKLLCAKDYLVGRGQHFVKSDSECW